jgi:YihY family inner membrane protein
MNMPKRIDQETHRAWAILCLSVKKFFRIDGGQWAGAFAFNAFFSLFPLVILFVTIASAFIDRNRAAKAIIAGIENYIPIGGEMQNHIFDTIASVIKARGQASSIALLILVWVGLQCFTTLICATNRAWGDTANNWWRLPLKSLALLVVTASAGLLGMAVQVLMRMAKGWSFTESGSHFRVFILGSFFIPLLVVFLSLSLFYRLAPSRSKRFAEVWTATLCATALLQAAEILFEIYLKHFATLNAVYGAFGGIMALLLWIYLSGCIFIFGACLCASQAEKCSAPVETTIAC